MAERADDEEKCTVTSYVGDLMKDPYFELHQDGRPPKGSTGRFGPNYWRSPLRKRKVVECDWTTRVNETTRDNENEIGSDRLGFDDSIFEPDTGVTGEMSENENEETNKIKEKVTPTRNEESKTNPMGNEEGTITPTNNSITPTRNSESITTEANPEVASDEPDKELDDEEDITSTTDGTGGGEASTATDALEVSPDESGCILPDRTADVTYTTDGTGGGEASINEATQEETKEHERVFSTGELDELAKGLDLGVEIEKEKYDKELEERLFPLDEVELKRRVKENSAQVGEMSLEDLSTVLGIEDEVLARTHESSPGVFSSPEYWLDSYRKTLATTGAAKRANRDFSDLGNSTEGGLPD